MKLSDRDLKLLVIFLMAVVIACPILFILRPYNKKIEAVNNHISELQERQSFLAKLNENRQFYNDSIALLDTERSKIVENYAKGLRDENTVIFLANVERQIPIAMTALSFSNGEPMVITEAHIDENGEMVDGLTAMTSFSTVGYTTTYDGFKSFLGYIMNNKDKMVISNVSADQSDEDGTITGSFVLSQYAVSGEGRALEPAKIPAMDHGTDNIFGVPLNLEEGDTGVEENVVEEEN